MTPKQINDLKKEHNAAMKVGQELYAQVMELHERCTALQRQIREAEGDEYDPIPLIFGEGFWTDPDL
jgi:uncharacterized protein involved in exopolysaccharide biosynthesis